MIFFNFIKIHLKLKIEIKDVNIFILQSIKSETIYSYLIYLNYVRDNTASTRKRRIDSLRSFYKYLYLYYPDFKSKNPLDSIGNIQIVQRLPKHFNLEQAQKLQNIFNKKNCRYPERNNAIITLFLNSGIRISELIGININDIDFKNKKLKIIAKGNRERTIYLNDFTISQIQKYLKIRNHNSCEALFLSNLNKRISIDAVEDICKKAYELLGVNDSNFSAHALRHTAGTIMYAHTKDLLITKEFLGHRSISSTEIYTHIENEEIRKAVQLNPLATFEV